MVLFLDLELSFDVGKLLMLCLAVLLELVKLLSKHLHSLIFLIHELTILRKSLKHEKLIVAYFAAFAKSLEVVWPHQKRSLFMYTFFAATAPTKIAKISLFLFS